MLYLISYIFDCMKRTFSFLLLLTAAITVLTSGSGCKSCNADDKRAAATIDTADYVPLAPARPVIRIDSATALKLRANFMNRTRRGHNTGTIMDMSTQDFTGAYTILYAPLRTMIEKVNVVLYNGMSANGEKMFVLVPSDKNYLIAPMDGKVCLRQNGTGVCPMPCDVRTLAAPDSITEAEALGIANAYFAQTEATKAYNAVQIDARSITAFDNTTKYLQMVWGYDTFDSTYSIQLMPILESGKQDWHQPIVSVPQINIVRQAMKL
jgi:hypothetical protein